MKNHPESLPAIVMRLLTYLGEHPDREHYAGKLLLVEARRMSTTFNEDAWFGHTTFFGKVDFSSATFRKEADFNRARFEARANFWLTR